MNVSVFRVCLIALLAAPLLVACGGDEAEVIDPIRAIKTITVSDRSSGQERRFPGVVEAVDTVTLSFEVRGNTREVNVDAGDRVVKGQILATLDETPFDLNVQAANAEVGKAKAMLAEKTTEFVRQKTLYEKQWVSKAAYDQALAGRDSASNQVSYAVSKLNLARRDLEKTALVTPFDGVIANRFAEPFQEVARGQKIFDMYAAEAMEVAVSIPETSIGKIYLGLQAQLTFPADGVPPLDGRVSEVGTVATDANAFAVKIALIDPPKNVLPGMTSEASLVLGDDEVDSSYLIPIAAIVPGEEPGHGYVFIYSADTSTVVRTQIRGGGVRDNRVVISEGIKGGDEIAVAGVSFLRDGQKVKLMIR